ncbi:MAG: hypothetical protein AAB484_03520 [Patescibacteria group bacterium]
MKNSQRGFVTPLIIIFLLAIGTGAYLYTNKAEEVPKSDPNLVVTTQTKVIDNNTVQITYSADVLGVLARSSSDLTLSLSCPNGIKATYSGNDICGNSVKIDSVTDVIFLNDTRKPQTVRATLNLLSGKDGMAVVARSTVETVIDPTSISITGRNLLGFEQAVNSSNWNEIQKFLSNKVYIVLEGSSCCGEKDSAQAVENLKGNFDGLELTFDEKSSLVKDYLNYMYSQYPSGRQVGASTDFFKDLVFGVENDAAQAYKATLGYRVESGKITFLFMNPGRDR